MANGMVLAPVARKDVALAQGRAPESEVEQTRRQAGGRSRARQACERELQLRADFLRERARSELLRGA